MTHPGAILFGLILLLSSGAAGASTLPFLGTLAFYVEDSNAGLLGPVSITGSGVAAVNGSGAHLTSFAISAGAISGLGNTPITAISAAPLAGLILSGAPGNSYGLPAANGAGSFTATGGLMGVTGFLKVCLSYIFTGATCPLAAVAVPLHGGASTGVGLGGPPITAFSTLVNIGVTMQGAPWVGSGSFGPGGTLQAFVHGPASGGASSAAQASAVMQYVTPLAIQTTIPASASMPGYGVLTLHFVPEPGTALLLGTGIAALAAAGRRRRRGVAHSPRAGRASPAIGQRPLGPSR